MIRVNRLRNRPVICANKPIGFLQNIILNNTQNRVECLIVARGIRGKCVVPACQVTAITGEFILASSVRKYTRDDEQRNPLFIRDTSGLLVGRITDYALDEKTMQIEAIEIVQGYFPKENRMRIWVFAYALSDSKAEELIVPPIQDFESIHQEEENSCVFQQ